MKNKFSIATSLAVMLAMLLTSLALADTIQSDGDIVTPASQTTINLGTVAPGATLTPKVSFQLSCAGNKHVDNGQSVTLTYSAGNSSIPAGGTLSATTASIGTVPTTWPDDGNNNCTGFLPINDNGDSTVTIVAPTAGGTYNFVVAYSAALNPGGDDDPSSITGSVPTVTYTVTVPSDTSAPAITPNVSGTQGNNGWYTSNVTVSWSVVDNESAISSSSGCGSTTINADTTTAGTTLTCTATSAGGTSSQSVTIKRDATAPTIISSPSPAANTNGWNNTDVTVSYSCTDNGPSGIDGALSDLGDDILTASGTASGTCVDLAGNSAGASYGAQIDKLKPVISGSRTPSANANGWNNTDVVVSFSCTDSGGSGLDTNTVAGATLSTEGAGQSVTNTGSCTDKAGNSADPATVSGINIDKTVPFASASASPGPNVNGWNNTNVTVSFSGVDGTGSGIDFCDPAVVLSSEGTGQSASGTCTDKAGNVSASAAASGIKIDKTAPTSISFVGGPAAGGSYYFGSLPAAPTCTADGAISGLASCAVTGYSTAVGPHTMTATATDNAGNQATATQSYTVLAWTLSGFYQPVDMNGVFNTVKGGSTVPLKFEVFAATELIDTSVVKSFVVTQIACLNSAPLDEIELTTTGGTSLRYDATGGQFIQNWQTPKPVGCYKVTMTTQDGSSLIALFKTK